MSQPNDEANPPSAGPGPEAASPTQTVSESGPAPGESGVITEEASPAPEGAQEEWEAIRARAAKADANWDLYLRTRAELDNYRRRATRERQEAVRYASLGLVEKLLPVLDSFDMALAATQAGTSVTLESLQQGIAMVQSQLRSVLAEAGVHEIDAQGLPFDPNLHEAVGHHESNEVADGHVLQQLRKGYQLHDRLVRPATVVVAKSPGA